MCVAQKATAHHTNRASQFTEITEIREMWLEDRA